jgi:hypothetical protein
MATVTVNLPTAKSWKTTLAGALMALGAYFQTLEGVYLIVGQVLVIGAPILMGLFAKDSNVTGGSVVQPSTEAAKEAITTAPNPLPPPAK